MILHDTVEQYIAKLEAEVETLKQQLNDDPRHWRFDWHRKAQEAEALVRVYRADITKLMAL